MRADPVLPAQSHVDLRRAARALVLTVWAGFFAYLWVSGEVSRYLGPRTYWVVPFGALALGTAAALHVSTMRSPEARPRPSVAEVLGLVVVLAPVIAVLIVPRAELGALAASRKATSAVGVAGAVLSTLPTPEGPPSFIDIHYADRSKKYAALAGIADGLEVDLVGFVTRDADVPGTFALTRFYVSCCAADAIPYSVPVDAGPAEFDESSWLRISGVLTTREDRIVLVAEDIEERAEPEDPYLY